MLSGCSTVDCRPFSMSIGELTYYRPWRHRLFSLFQSTASSLPSRSYPNHPTRLIQDLGSRLDLTPSAHNRSIVTVWTGSTLSVHRWCTRPSQSRSAVWPLTPSPPASLLTLQKGPSPFQKTTRRPLLFKNISINAPTFSFLAPTIFQK